MRRALLLLLVGIPLLQAGFQPPAAPQAKTSVPKHIPFLEEAKLVGALQLPDPPASGSLGEAADRLVVRLALQFRSPEQVVWAQQMDEARIWTNAAVLGPDFKPELLPTCAKFFDRLRTEVYLASREPKKRFNRPRPFQADPAIHIPPPIPDSPSFPSGHAVQIYSWLNVLTELFPDRKMELEAYADRVAWARILLGVHYPSDLVAGRVLADQLLKAYRETADWKAGIEACRRELAGTGLRKAG